MRIPVLRSAALLCAGTLLSFLALAQTGAPPDAAGRPARSAQEIVSGRCALCHGLEGESASPVYPRLAAQHPNYLQKQLRDFRDGRRRSDTMSEMAKDLRDDEIAALASYFAARKAAARQPGDVDLAGVGRYIFTRGNSYSGVPACASCHGPLGHGTESLPRLAGQHPSYIEIQLKDFNRRERTNDNLKSRQSRCLSAACSSLPGSGRSPRPKLRGKMTAFGFFSRERQMQEYFLKGSVAAMCVVSSLSAQACGFTPGMSRPAA